MDIWSVIILSVVEGLTEFLPISSTGHLMVTAKILNLPSSDFLSSFNIFIQLGAILAVGVLYFNKIIKNLNLVPKVGVAFVPTAIIGFFLYPLIKNFLLESLTVVAISLFIGGVILIIFEKWYQKRGLVNMAEAELDKISYKQAFLIGLAQTLAVIPGTSRSGATILGGLALGLSRATIVEFSFLLALPTMAAASGYDLLKSGVSFSEANILWLGLGFVLSFVFSIISVRWLVRFIKQHNFIWFGWYRIALALVIFSFLI